MPIRAIHDIEDFHYEIGGYVPVEQVAHGVHENDLWFLPFQGDVQGMLMNGQVEPVHVIRLAHSLKSPGHALGIAVRAARTDLRATRGRIPR